MTISGALPRVTKADIDCRVEELMAELTPTVGHDKALVMVMAFQEDCRIFYGDAGLPTEEECGYLTCKCETGCARINAGVA